MSAGKTSRLDLTDRLPKKKPNRLVLLDIGGAKSLASILLLTTIEQTMASTPDSTEPVRLERKNIRQLAPPS
jgi:hypothetical protein